MMLQFPALRYPAIWLASASRLVTGAFRFPGAVDFSDGAAARIEPNSALSLVGAGALWSCFCRFTRLLATPFETLQKSAERAVLACAAPAAQKASRATAVSAETIFRSPTA